MYKLLLELFYSADKLLIGHQRKEELLDSINLVDLKSDFEEILNLIEKNVYA